MLQAIISPAKQMRVALDAFAPRDIPPFPRQTAQLHRALTAIAHNQGPHGLQELWRVNDRLLEENSARLGAFTPIESADELADPAVARHASCALFSYVGIQYRSMAPEVLDEDALAWLQEHLWIVSALYGCARPFDAVEPYRLEMGAKLAVGDARDLYGFWGDRIARAVAPCEETVVVNLASVEYAKAVLPFLGPKTQVVTCVFGEGVKGGKPVQRATASKIARGSMVRWMAEHRVEHACDLERFDVGYARAPQLDTAATLRGGARGRTLVFLKA